MKAKSKKESPTTDSDEKDDDSWKNIEDEGQGAEEGQLYTFDDIPKYCRVYYMGRLGWVVQKGYNVRDNNGDRHIKIQYKEKHAGKKYSKVHEKLVNKFLRKQKRLWVDFDKQFEEYHD
jgi:hypothetical protein